MVQHTAEDLARFLGCALEGDGAVLLTGIASPEKAGPGDLVYVESAREAHRASGSSARCVITRADIQLPGKTVLVAVQPKAAFARAAEWLLPPRPIAEGVHPTAVIAKSARLAADVGVGPFVVIEAEVEVGPGTQVGAFCFLGQRSKVGRFCQLYPRVTLYAGVNLGNRVIVHSGVVLGSDGFGYIAAADKLVKFPQAGSLEIQDDVEIGANTTIDRGSLDVTSIGAQVKIDNLVHIAHNVEIGERTVVAAQTGIAGSSIVGKNVVVGGQVGIGDHCQLEDACVVGSQAGVLPRKTIRSGQTVWGTPARPLDHFKEQYAWFGRLSELAKRIRKLEDDNAKEA
jgi:UDP-3-O-[3-hydroxymyristoyl] glucosamine N-acyltransferase